jgi:hypothetical protein
MYSEGRDVALSQFPFRDAHTRNESRLDCRICAVSDTGNLKCVADRYFEVCAYDFKRISGKECMR